MKIAIFQIDPIVGHFEYNLLLIKKGIERAKEEGCDLAVFPELAIMGYPPKDLLEKPAFIEDNLRYIEKVAELSEGIYVLCGYVERNPKPTGKRLINAVALLSGGRIISKGGKILLPTYDLFDEARYFESAQESLLFDLMGKRIGVTICEDIWNFGDSEEVSYYERDPVSELKRRGMELLINISASPYTVEKGKKRMEMLERIASIYKIPCIYCNQVGGNDDLIFDGLSMVVDEKARPVLLAKGFEEDILIYDTELEYEEIQWPYPSEEQSILNALILGTRDYVIKCGFNKVIVGLSGGIDSSLVAVIASEALGSENVMGVSMPSCYTSSMSREDAKRLSDNLNINFFEIPIDEIFKLYLKVLEPVFKGLGEDETEENIQARIRGNLLMALSNKFRALVLTTGNKAEIATGYCTLYGDTAGALAVLCDIPKTLCYRLARFINRESEIIPERIIRRPPTAELRAGQTDQDTLPPYEILDSIVDASVVKNLSMEELISRGFEQDIVLDVFRRLNINEYKRRQLPPGLKITSKASGYGRRYPIAKGGKYY